MPKATQLVSGRTTSNLCSVCCTKQLFPVGGQHGPGWGLWWAPAIPEKPRALPAQAAQPNTREGSRGHAWMNVGVGRGHCPLEVSGSKNSKVRSQSESSRDSKSPEAALLLFLSIPAPHPSRLSPADAEGALKAPCQTGKHLGSTPREAGAVGVPEIHQNYMSAPFSGPHPKG